MYLVWKLLWADVIFCWEGDADGLCALQFHTNIASYFFILFFPFFVVPPISIHLILLQAGYVIESNGQRVQHGTITVSVSERTNE